MSTHVTRTTPTAAPVLSPASRARLEAIDSYLLAWARDRGAEERQFPALIAHACLVEAGYPEAFPHLLMTACACREPARTDSLLGADNLEPVGWALSPAVCYHAYAHWRGLRLASGETRLLTARGRCFRREAQFVAGRRQLEFEMREIVLVGATDELEPWLARARERVGALAAELGVTGGRWVVAEDPFFLPSATGRALVQRLLETKLEYVVDLPGSDQPLALASINRHAAFFGERFDLRLADGAPAHTACVAFGLDRWLAASAHPLSHEQS